MTIRKRRAETCLSDFAIDRWLGGELAAGEVAAHEAHLASCASCTRLVGEARTRFASFPAHLPATIAAAASRAKAASSRTLRWPRLASVAGALALAATILFAVRSRPSIDGSAIERIKGNDHRITFHVRHAGAVSQGIDGDHFEPGDGLQFSYTARSASHLAIFSVDGARQVSVYYADGDRAARIEPGEAVALPKSTVLDGTLGSEVIYALFCDEAVTVGPIRAQLTAEPTRPPKVTGCTVDRHEFMKVAR